MDSTGQRIARKLRHTASQWDLDEPSDLEQMAELIDSELARERDALAENIDKWAELCSTIGLDPWDASAEQIVEMLRKKAAPPACGS